jgi:hypothetical protein
MTLAGGKREIFSERIRRRKRELLTRRLSGVAVV